MAYKNKKNKKQYMKEWRQKNKEKIKEYRQENKEDRKEYDKDNKEKIKEYQKEWRLKNKEYHKQYKIDNQEYIKQQNKKYYVDHKEHRKEYENKKRRMDLKYNLNRKISRAIWNTLKGNKAGRHWESLVGYTVEDLINHLKTTMPKNCTWNDYMNGKLHIDHRIPIAAHNFDNSNQIDFRNCWSLSNLQLLPAEENLIKGAKLKQPFQPSLKMAI